MKRYDMQVGRIKHDCGESFVANMVEVEEGRYAEHAEANARIAELAAEVDSLRSRLAFIEVNAEAGELSAKGCANIARNALKEGV